MVLHYVQNISGNLRDDGYIEEMDYVQKILAAAKDGSIYLISSAITKIECLHDGSEGAVSQEAIRLFKSILDSGRVVRTISVSNVIIENARQMYWDKFPMPSNIDKIHIASAIFTECSEIITFDNYNRAKKKNDFACIEELCKQYGLSIVYPSESAIAKMEYVDWVKAQRAKAQKDASKGRQEQMRLLT
ncbi:type II toxin-antitoxin system VapC family toxin [Oceanidesulfovibrio indonesiensis]|nr:type II toxin-antitoxin system VapC family toxin [Oceanidesulfovibrio indonesiensis]